jgi:transcriptional regulator with XRE-family HTH domain
MQENHTMLEKGHPLLAAEEGAKKPEQPVRDTAASLPPTLQAVAERLRTARVAAHLTQQELARGLFSKSYISAVERGKMVPSLQALNVLAQRLAVPVSYLLGEQSIDPAALAESSAALLPAEEQISAPPDENLLLLLDKAEAFLREDQPQEALAVLGEGETPPAGLALLQWLRWYRLAGWTAGLLRNSVKAVRLLESGLALSQQIRTRISPAEQAQLTEMIEYLHCFLGRAFCDLDQPHQALEYYQRGLEAIRKDRIADPELKALIYTGLGRIALALGHHTEASTYYHEAAKQASAVENQRLLGLIFWGLAVSYQERGDPFRAKTYFLSALNALEQHGNPYLLLQIRAGLGQALLNLQDYQGAEPYLLLGMRDAQALGDTRTYGIALANIASLHRARGELPQAIASANAALQWVQQHPDQRTEGQLHLTFASIYEAKQDQSAREQALREAIRLLEQAEEFSLLGTAYESYAQFLSEQGRFQEAYQQLALAHRPAQDAQSPLDRNTPQQPG